MVVCSIVVGTHQRLGLLKEALDSAFNQRGVEVEVIVVENGSTDGTREYLRSITDSRLVPMFYDEPLGGTRARNLGLAAATGDWVGFLDDDDLWAPDKLQAEIEAAEASGRSWAYTGCVYIDGECNVIGGLPPLSPEEVAERSPMRYSVPAGTSSMIWKAGMLDQDGLLEPRLTYAVDWDISLRLLRRGMPAAVEKPLVAYRQHGANMSVRSGRYLSELEVIEEKFRDLRGGRPLDVAYQYRNAASENARAGRRRQALKLYGKAARLGDRGALLRAAAILAPRQSWGWLRRRVLADENWMREAEQWLEPHRRQHGMLEASGVQTQA